MEKRGRLLYKMMILFLGLSLIPLFFTRFLLLNIAQKSIRNEVLNIQQGIAERAANNITSYFDNIKNILFVIQKSPDFLTMSPNQQGVVIRSLMEYYELFFEISTIDTTGRERIRLRRFSNTSTELRNLKDTKMFNEVRTKGEYISNLRFTEDNYPAVTIAVPIEREIGIPIGIIAAEVNLITLSEIVAKIKIGEKGFAFLVDENGALIAHKELDRVLKRESFNKSPILKQITEETKPVQQKTVFQVMGNGFNQAFGQKRDWGEFTDTTTKIKHLFKYVKVENRPWWIVVQQPITEAYATAHKMESQVNIFIIVVMILTIILGTFFTNYIVNPIRLLQHETDKLRKGDFNVSVVVDTNDEIEELGENFMSMAKALRERTNQLQSAKKELEIWSKNLERMVDERTKQLREAQEELVKRERLAAVGQMANVVGHEIRNPLSIINNSIYYIKSKVSKLTEAVDEKVFKHIGIIEKEIDNSNKIVNDLLGFSRTRELKPELINANEIFEEILMILPIPQNVTVNQNLMKDLPKTMIDRDEMRQVLLNIIGNAVQAMPEGGGVTISTSAVNDKLILNKFTDKPQAIKFEITDTGCGMPKDIIDKIFQPFFTTKSKGTGLGLAVVQRVTERHKGKLEVKSEVGKGSSFFIYIPVVDTWVAPPPAPPSTPPQKV